jgi:Redoxin
VVAVNVGLNDSREAIEAYRRELGISMPIVIDDGRLAEALNLTITPQHVVIGRDGRIDYVGFLANDRLDTALRAAAQTPAPTAEPERAQQTPAARAEAAGRVPDVSAITLDGRTFRTRDPSDRRPTVFVFMSSWCESYLARQRPEMGATCRQVREQIASIAPHDTRVRWLGVAIGLWATEAQLRDYAAESESQIPLTFDESDAWFRAFGVTSFPTVVIADADGQIVKRIVGYDPNLPIELDGLF